MATQNTHEESSQQTGDGQSVYIDMSRKNNGYLQQEFLKIKDSLESAYAEEGGQALFECAIKSYPPATCVWHKEGSLLKTDQRIQKTSFRKQHVVVFKLEISNITAEDSGIYTIVCENTRHVVSSHASLLVINTQDTEGIIYYPVTNIPEKVHNVVTLKPTNAQVKQDDIIELVATFQTEVDKITWYKNNEEIVENFRTIILKSENISVLGLMKGTLSDTGTYYVVARCRQGQIIASVAHVYVLLGTQELNATECNNSNTEDIDHEEDKGTLNPSEEGLAVVGKPLSPVVATLGCSVMFDCSFNLDDVTFHYVIWYVGQYRIERSNRQFCVVNQGTNFFLYIKKLDPDMAGVVTCELRKAVHCELGKSKLISSTSSTLSIAPKCVVDHEKKTNPELATERLYCAKTGEGTFSTGPKYNLENMPEPVIKSNETNTVELMMTFCRLNNQGLFYFFASISNTEIGATIQIADGDPRKVHITVDKSCLPSNVWYAVDVALSDGSYMEIGVSSDASFDMKEPPELNIVKTRLRPVTPVEDAAESSVFMDIAPPEEDVIPLKCTELRSIEEFQTDYITTGGRLGLGSFGTVELVQDAKGKYYAAKKVRTLCKTSHDKVNAEFEIMKRLQHPKVIHLVEGFKDTRNFVIVMEYLWGGELFERVSLEEHIQEEDVVSYVRQLCEALVYIHKQNIVHLDIKPENIICLSPNSCRIKIIDFGIAKMLEEGRVTRAFEGTKEYISPEILNYDVVTPAADMWSIGVVTYTLLSGLSPFDSAIWPEMSAKITRAEYGYEDEAFDNVSWLSKNFIDQLLKPNPSDRLTAEQALQHSWLKYGPPTGVSARHNMRRTRENLKTYLHAYRSKWQRARNVILAAHRLRNPGHASAARGSATK